MRTSCWIVLLLISSVAFGQEQPEENAKIAIRMAKAEADSLKLTQDGQELKIEPKPLLRWSNPLSGEIYGDVYIWTRDGRPEAIASIYKWFSPFTHLATEIQSLSESDLSMTRNGQTVWSTGKGLEMHLLPETLEPNVREYQRSRQMRSIAQQFKAKAEDRKDPKSTWFLRPLPKPIFRYQSERRGIVDGAMFAYCQGDTNNPEVLLILEARKKDGKLAWYYGLGRQNSLRFTVHRNGELIWDVPKLAPPWPAVTMPNNPYLVIKTQLE